MKSQSIELKCPRCGLEFHVHLAISNDQVYSVIPSDYEETAYGIVWLANHGSLSALLKHVLFILKNKLGLSFTKKDAIHIIHEYFGHFSDQAEILLNLLHDSGLLLFKTENIVELIE